MHSCTVSSDVATKICLFYTGDLAVLLTRTLEQGPGPGLGCQGPGQGQGLESEGQAPRQ